MRMLLVVLLGVLAYSPMAEAVAKPQKADQFHFSLGGFAMTRSGEHKSVRIEPKAPLAEESRWKAVRTELSANKLKFGVGRHFGGNLSVCVGKCLRDRTDKKKIGFGFRFDRKF